MVDQKFRSIIKFFVEKGESLSDTFMEIQNVYGDESPNYGYVKRWHREFRLGRQSVENAPRSGRPLEIDFSGLKGPVTRRIQEDRTISIEMIASEFDLSYSSAWKLIRRELGYKKLTTTWIPHLLTPAQKQLRVQCCQEALAGYKKQPNAFLKTILTMDETWVFTHEPLSRTEAMEWVQSKDQVSQRPKVIAGAKKLMLSVFWDYKGIVYQKFLEPGETIDGEEYRAQLDQVARKLQTERPDRPKRRPILLQDNARPHKAALTIEKINELGWSTINHPPYSPDLAPSDYYLFSNLKRYLRGKNFSTLDALKGEISNFFESRPAEWYFDGISKLPHRWQSCIDANGSHIQ